LRIRRNHFGCGNTVQVVFFESHSQSFFHASFPYSA
jgi:hypothetical protein